ncbi:hypothetical protein A7U60_g9165 [Sanghuangporus baumii]|uniref:DUF6533 domain-containing protein n=1 Tax=Sanghuangporus baumii TaxID=108892 RepID=A0A9Q5N2G0_SANBA|nr:hypothetical protein A7U60_g9165 [Sanghuangporus baumii]
MTGFFNTLPDSKAVVDGPPAEPLGQMLISEVSTSQYFAVAIASALVYHSITTVDKEIKYFWPKPCSTVSLVFFVNRYIGLLGALCNVARLRFTQGFTSCTSMPIRKGLALNMFIPGLFSSWALSLANLVTIVSIDCLFSSWALSLANLVTIVSIDCGKLATCLNIFLALEGVIDLGLLIYDNLFQEVSRYIVAEGISICGGNRAPLKSLHVISWSIPMAYGLVLLCLAVYKATDFWRLATGFKGTRLVRTIILDQVLYYIFVVFCCLLQIVELSFRSDSPFVTSLLSALGSPSFLCILGSQLLINLKEVSERRADGGTNYTPRNVSDIELPEMGPV